MDDNDLLRRLLTRGVGTTETTTIPIPEHPITTALRNARPIQPGPRGAVASGLRAFGGEAVASVVGAIPGAFEMLGMAPKGLTKGIHEAARVLTYTDPELDRLHPIGNVIGEVVGSIAAGIGLTLAVGTPAAGALSRLKSFQTLVQKAPLVARGMQFAVEGMVFETTMREPRLRDAIAWTATDWVVRSKPAAEAMSRLLGGGKAEKYFPRWDYAKVNWMTKESFQGRERDVIELVQALARDTNASEGEIVELMAKTELFSAFKRIFDSPEKLRVSEGTKVIKAKAANYVTVKFADEAGTEIITKDNTAILNLAERLIKGDAKIDLIVGSEQSINNLRRQLLAQTPEEMSLLYQIQRTSWAQQQQQLRRGVEYEGTTAAHKLQAANDFASVSYADGRSRLVRLNREGAKEIRNAINDGTAQITEFVLRDPTNTAVNDDLIRNWVDLLYGRRYNWEARGVFLEQSSTNTISFKFSQTTEEGVTTWHTATAQLNPDGSIPPETVSALIKNGTNIRVTGVGLTDPSNVAARYKVASDIKKVFTPTSEAPPHVGKVPMQEAAKDVVEEVMQRQDMSELSALDEATGNQATLKRLLEATTPEPQDVQDFVQTYKPRIEKALGIDTVLTEGSAEKKQVLERLSVALNSGEMSPLNWLISTNMVKNLDDDIFRLTKMHLDFGSMSTLGLYGETRRLVGVPVGTPGAKVTLVQGATAKLTAHEIAHTIQSIFPEETLVKWVKAMMDDPDVMRYLSRNAVSRSKGASEAFTELMAEYLVKRFGIGDLPASAIKPNGVWDRLWKVAAQVWKSFSDVLGLTGKATSESKALDRAFGYMDEMFVGLKTTHATHFTNPARIVRETAERMLGGKAWPMGHNAAYRMSRIAASEFRKMLKGTVADELISTVRDGSFVIRGDTPLDRTKNAQQVVESLSYLLGLRNTPVQMVEMNTRQAIDNLAHKYVGRGSVAFTTNFGEVGEAVPFSTKSTTRLRAKRPIDADELDHLSNLLAEHWDKASKLSTQPSEMGALRMVRTADGLDIHIGTVSRDLLPDKGALMARSFHLQTNVGPRPLPFYLAGNRLYISNKVGTLVSQVADPGIIDFRVGEFVDAVTDDIPRRLRTELVRKLTDEKMVDLRKTNPDLGDREIRKKANHWAMSFIDRVNDRLVKVADVSGIEAMGVHVRMNAAGHLVLDGPNSQMILDKLAAKGWNWDDIIYGFTVEGEKRTIDLGRWIQRTFSRTTAAGRTSSKIDLIVDDKVKPGFIQFRRGRDLLEVDLAHLIETDLKGIGEMRVSSMTDASVFFSKAPSDKAPLLLIHDSKAPEGYFQMYLRPGNKPASAEADIVVNLPSVFEKVDGYDLIGNQEVRNLLSFGYRIQGIAGNFNSIPKDFNVAHKISTNMRDNIQRFPLDNMQATPEGLNLLNKLSRDRNLAMTFSPDGMSVQFVRHTQDGPVTVVDGLQTGQEILDFLHRTKPWDVADLLTGSPAANQAILDEIRQIRVLHKIPDFVPAQNVTESVQETIIQKMGRKGREGAEGTKKAWDGALDWVTQWIGMREFAVQRGMKGLPKTPEGKPLVDAHAALVAGREGQQLAGQEYWSLVENFNQRILQVPVERRQHIGAIMANFVVEKPDLMDAGKRAIRDRFLTANAGRITPDDLALAREARELADEMAVRFGVTADPNLNTIVGYFRKKLYPTIDSVYSEPRVGDMKDPGFLKERQVPGYNSEIDFDVMKMVNLYAYEGSRHKHIKPVSDNIKEMLTALRTKHRDKALTPEQSRSILYTIRELEHIDMALTGRYGASTNQIGAAFQDVLQRATGDVGLAQKIVDKLIPLAHMGVLGFRFGSPFRNAISQPLMVFPAVGRADFVEGWRRAIQFRRGAHQEFADVLSMPFLDKFNKGSEFQMVHLFERHSPQFMKLYKGSMFGMRLTEQTNRLATYFAGIANGEKLIARARTAGKVTDDLINSSFLSHLDTYASEKLVTVLEAAIKEGPGGTASQRFLRLYAENLVGTTMFRYGTMEGMMLGKSTTGKLATVFGTWSAGYVTYLRRGLLNLTNVEKTGRRSLTPYGKQFITRWLGIHALGFATYEGMGIASREFFFRPSLYLGSPYASIAADTYDWMRLSEHDRPAAANRLLRNLGAIFIPGSQGMKELQKLSDHWMDDEYLKGLSHLIGTPKEEVGRGATRKHEKLLGIF